MRTPLLLFAALLMCVALSSCSEAGQANLNRVMEKPAKDMTTGMFFLIVVVGAMLSSSSHSCNCKDK